MSENSNIELKVKDALNNINNIQKQSEDINSNYAGTAVANLNMYLETNRDSISKIVDSINQNLSKLNLIQNELNVKDNINKSTLLKYEQLLKLENEDLKKQLQELEIIQTTISTKDRLIQQTDNNLENKNLDIKVLVIISFLSILLLIIIILYSFNNISSYYFYTYLIIILISYLIVYLYSYNIFYFKDAINTIFHDSEKEIIQSVLKFDNFIENGYTDAVKYLEKEWIKDNCSCTPEEMEYELENIYSEDPNIYENEIPGYFYHDGTSPQQLIYTNSNNKLNESVDWVDYSQDGERQYNPFTNKTTYTNKNFYNYKSRDPSIRQLKNLSDSKKLVNNNTLTANI